MPRYRIRSGDVDSAGNWLQRSYDEFFVAPDMRAAMDEIDRALRDNEIKGVETGHYVRVDGLDGSARRCMGSNHYWDAIET